MTRKALIVVDMQNDFIDGTLGTPEAQAIVANAKGKIFKYAHDRNARIIYTRDTHQEDYLHTNEGIHLPVEHCLEGSDGWQIQAALLPNPGFAHAQMDIIDKPSFGYTGWEAEHLGEFDIELIGLCTDICVISNALILKALYPENKISVDAACCAGVTPQAHAAALATMRSCQIEILND